MVRLVDWWWIGGGKVEGVGSRVAVVVEWGSDEWRWQSNYHIVVSGIHALTSSLFVIVCHAPPLLLPPRLLPLLCCWS